MDDGDNSEIFAKILATRAYVRADVTAVLYIAYCARANAVQFRSEAGQLRRRAQLLRALVHTTQEQAKELLAGVQKNCSVRVGPPREGREAADRPKIRRGSAPVRSDLAT